MAIQHILLFAGGLSFVPLLFASGGLQANAPATAAPAVPTVTETSRVGSSVTSATTTPPVTAASTAPPVASSSAAPPATATSTADSNPAGRISAEPITGPATAGTPPQPSPLAPLSAPSPSGAPEPAAPSTSGTAESAASAEGVIDAEAKAAVAGAALAPAPSTPAAANMSIMPANPPPDVIDDGAPITESFFDRQDDLNDH